MMKMKKRWMFLLSFGTFVFIFIYFGFLTYYIGSCLEFREPSHAEVLEMSERVRRENELLFCDNTTPRTYYAQRGDFWVLYNYVMATKRFKCDESITYTTHADFTFLDNLVPLLERWGGPLSISLYSPGTDFMETLKRISYLRDCSESPLVKELVTFHLYFDIKNMPKGRIPSLPMSLPFGCSAENKVTFGEGISTFKKEKNLTYPVNVGRMIARDMANTYYVLPSDIELYPSPDLIPAFLEMVRRDHLPNQTPNRKVFVLPIFEADINIRHLPHNKSQLIDMLKQKTVIPFHKSICLYCHLIPKADQWLTHPISQGMRVFHVEKRRGTFRSWEPFYIGTKFEPGYDERLSWEGKGDKMTQGFALCVLDYEFHILDNAFLIHRPGIKRFSNNITNFQRKQTYQAENEIVPELKILYGTKKGCILGLKPLPLI